VDEFSLIRRFFSRSKKSRTDVTLGIGDDAAILRVPDEHELVVTTDMLVAGVHFPNDTAADAIGYKALAVNLSDLAAMGADPAWATVNLSMPQAEAEWLEGFCNGFFELADEFGVALVGGDTCRGPVTIGVQLCGFAPTGKALRRSGAKPGDAIYVTGTVGDAALGLLHAEGKLQLTQAQASYVRARLERPTPRVGVGRALRGLASAAIDLSDGLAADLGHILEQSNAGARIELAALPLSPVYSEQLQKTLGWDLAVTNGDDYELCFTVPPIQEQRVTSALAGLAVDFRRVGAIESEPGLRFYGVDGVLCEFPDSGFNHFQG